MKNRFLCIILLCTPIVQAQVLFTHTKNNITLTIEDAAKCPQVLVQHMPAGVSALLVTIENKSDDTIALFKDDIRANRNLSTNNIIFNPATGLIKFLGVCAGLDTVWTVNRASKLYNRGLYKTLSTQQYIYEFLPFVALWGAFFVTIYDCGYKVGQIRLAIDKWNFNTNMIRVIQGSKISKMWLVAQGATQLDITVRGDKNGSIVFNCDF